MTVIGKVPPRLGSVIGSDPRLRGRGRPQRRMSTNRTGNKRHGQDYDTEFLGGGDTAHVYADGRRVIVHHDAAPEDVHRSLFSQSVGSHKPKSKPGKNSDAARKRRARERSNATTYNPSATLSGNDLRRMVNDLVDAQTRPLLDDLERQRVNTEAQSGRVTANARNYYNDLLAKQQQLTAAAQGISDRANASQSAAANEVNAAQTAMAKAASAGAGQDAGARGSIADIANARVAADLAAQAESQAKRNATGAAFLASQGSAGERGANDMSTVLGLKGSENLRDITSEFAKRLGDIGAKRSEVVEKRGDLRADTLAKLRQQQFENLVTGQTLGIKQDEVALGRDKLSETGRHNKAMEKAAMTANEIRRMHNDRTYRLDKEKFGAAQAKDKYQRRHKVGPYKPGGKGGSGGGGGGLGSLSPAQEQAKLDSIDSIRSLVASGRKHYKDNWQKVEQALRSGQNPENKVYPALYIKVAIEMERDGAISRDTAAALQQRGIHVGGVFPISGGAQDYDGGN